jgi:hypothetical protein
VVDVVKGKQHGASRVQQIEPYQDTEDHNALGLLHWENPIRSPELNPYPAAARQQLVTLVGGFEVAIIGRHLSAIGYSVRFTFESPG